jgi:hypothetical protein
MLGEGAVVSLVGEFVVEWFFGPTRRKTRSGFGALLAHDVALWSVFRLTVGQVKDPQML